MQKLNIKTKKQRGMVLAVSLYVLVILMTLGFTLITTSIAELHNAENSKNSTLAFYLADAGIEEALANWANNPLILNTLNTQPVSISYLCFSQDPRNGKTINQGIYTVYMEKLPLKPGESPLYKLFSFGFLIDPQNFSYQNLGASKAQRALMALVREKTSNYVLFSNDGTSGIYSYPYGFNYHGQISGDVRLNSNIFISGNYGKIDFNNKIEITGVQIGGISPNPKGGFYPQSEFLAFPPIDINNFIQIAESQHKAWFGTGIATNYHWSVVNQELSK
ncbi:MAG: pilus assembly PilX N-terminal domain-containing protein [Armatimonadetes bacterium]|nr:pilus assembly PilX N-terminal domain-containing protein [Armatimonadota bacterium]